MKRTITLLLAMILCLGALMTGCADNTTPGMTPGDKTQNNDKTDTVSAPEIVLTENDSIMIGKVGDKEISFAEYRAYFNSFRYEYDLGDASFWETDNDLKENLYSQVESEIKAATAIPLLAAQKNVAFTDEQRSALDEYMAEMIEQNNSVAGTSYLEELAKYNFTDAVYRQLIENNTLGSLLYQTAYTATDEQILEYADENYVRVKHILFKTTALDEEEKASIKALADSVADRAKNGEDFESLVTEYSEDGMDVETGYYFTKGYMVKSFEDASYALEIGEISDPIESEYGYHIIKKYEMEDEYILSSDDVKSEIALSIMAVDYQNELLSLASTLTFEKYENFDEYLQKLWDEASNNGAEEVADAEFEETAE